jgi:hypothetical protein
MQKQEQADQQHAKQSDPEHPRERVTGGSPREGLMDGFDPILTA